MGLRLEIFVEWGIYQTAGQNGTQHDTERDIDSRNDLAGSLARHVNPNIKIQSQCLTGGRKFH